VHELLIKKDELNKGFKIIFLQNLKLTLKIDNNRKGNVEYDYLESKGWFINFIK